MFCKLYQFFLSKSNLLSTIIVTNLLENFYQYKHSRLYFFEHCFLKKWAAFELEWLLKSVLNIFELIRIRFIKFYMANIRQLLLRIIFFSYLVKLILSKKGKHRYICMHYYERVFSFLFYIFNVFLYLFLYLSDITYMIVKKGVWSKY